MKNYIQNGSVLPLLATAAVYSGEPLLSGAFFGVANKGAAIGQEFGLVRVGVFELNKVNSEAWSIGDKLYWDDTGKKVTTVATDNTLIGAAWADAANPSETGTVFLDGVIR